MHSIEEIPTAPNSPNSEEFMVTEGGPSKPSFSHNSLNNSPKLSPQNSLGSTCESFDIISSIESLDALPRPFTPLPEAIEGPQNRLAVQSQTDSVNSSTTEPMNSHLEQNSEETASNTDSIPVDMCCNQNLVQSELIGSEISSLNNSAISSNYGFVMPSLSLCSLTHAATTRGVTTHVCIAQPPVGMLNIGITGKHSSTAIDSLLQSSYKFRALDSADSLGTHSSFGFNAQLSVEAWVCSVSNTEQDNMILFDVNLAPKEVCQWLVDRLRKSQPVHAIIYCIEQIEEQDIVAMLDIQKVAELILFFGKSTDKDSKWRNQLENRGVKMRYVWDVQDHEHLFHRLCSQATRIRANSSKTQQKWFQSQLVVTTLEPAGALCKHVNLRQRAMESIGNIDPLGVVHWSTVPRVTSLVITGVVSGAIAAFGVSFMLSKLISEPETPVPCRRHAIFDIEDWPTWLVK